MKSTNKRIKLDLGKLLGFNQHKSLPSGPNSKRTTSMVGAVKAMVGTVKPV